MGSSTVSCSEKVQGYEYVSCFRLSFSRVASEPMAGAKESHPLIYVTMRPSPQEQTYLLPSMFLVSKLGPARNEKVAASYSSKLSEFRSSHSKVARYIPV